MMICKVVLELVSHGESQAQRHRAGVGTDGSVCPEQRLDIVVSYDMIKIR